MYAEGTLGMVIFVDEHGGRIGVLGDGGKYGAVIHINECRNGVVSTWDKNRDRLK